MKRIFSVRYQNTLLLFVTAYCTILIAVSCAKVVAPTGGPKDTDPPEILDITPEDGSVLFSDEKIVFRFNEFFTLKNPARNIYLNPLIEDEIRYAIRGKQLIIRLPQSLKENQTYTLHLNDVIADFHEGNMMPSQKFVFSTGPHVDSLGVTGKVIDARTAEPVEDVQVYLFPVDADSALLKRQFAFMTVSSTGGQFDLKHLPEGEYSLYALTDKDFDHVFSSKDEKPGFYHENVRTGMQYINDTLSTTTLKLEKPLYIFKEQDSIIRILKSAFVRQGLVHIILNQPVTSAEIRPVEAVVADSVLTTIGKSGDTLSLWIIGRKADAASFVITADQQLIDTIGITLKPPSRGVTPTAEPVKMTFKPANTFDQNRFHHKDTVKFFALSPISSVRKDSISVLHKADTLGFEIMFSPLHPLEFMLIFAVDPDVKYETVFRSGAVIDCFGAVNDSVSFSLKSTDSLYYGNLFIKLEGLSDECFVIEIAGSGKAYSYSFDTWPEDDRFEFSELIPGDYVLRLIADANCNGQWDTGNFSERRQPEKVYRLPGKINIRSNWDNEIVWSVE